MIIKTIKNFLTVNFYRLEAEIVAIVNFIFLAGPLRLITSVKI